MPLVGAPWVMGVAGGTVRIARNAAHPGPNAAAGAILAFSLRGWRSDGLGGRTPAGIVLGGPPVPPRRRPPFPAVAGVDLSVLRDGDLAEVDGGRGTVRLPRLREVRVVTVFLERSDGRLLLLRRSEQVGSYRGRWAGVSGFLEERTPRAQGIREVEEETGLPRRALSAVREGAVVPVRDGGTLYFVHPMRFRTRSVAVRLDWEHTAFAWVRPTELARRPTVPRLRSAWRAVA